MRSQTSNLPCLCTCPGQAGSKCLKIVTLQSIRCVLLPVKSPEYVQNTWRKIGSHDLNFYKSRTGCHSTTLPSVGYLLPLACQWNVKHKQMQLESMDRFKASVLPYFCTPFLVYGSMWLTIASNNTIYQIHLCDVYFCPPIIVHLFGRPEIGRMSNQWFVISVLLMLHEFTCHHAGL